MDSEHNLKMPLSGRSHGHGHSDKRHENPSTYVYTWVWACCNCSQSAGMAVESTDICPNCDHLRCMDCPTETIKTTTARAGSSASSSVRFYGEPSSTSGIARVRSSTSAEVGAHQSSMATNAPYISDLFRDTSPIHDVFPNADIDEQEDEDDLESAENSREPIQFEGSLIPLLVSVENDEGLYTLRTEGDAELLKFWHSIILPSVMTRPALYSGLRSMHLLRQGPNEEDSIPVIFISIKSVGCDPVDETSLREKISMLFEEPLRPTLRISFEESAMRRTMESEDPPICKPRNIYFQDYPKSGASIGIKNRVDSTATLGGYLMIDGEPHILTVDHFVPDDFEARASIPQAIFVTHISEQEAQSTTPWTKIMEFLPSLTVCCDFCRRLWKKHSRDTDFYKSVDLVEYGEEIQCQTAHKFRDLKRTLFRAFPVETLGRIICRSQTRSRSSATGNGEYQIEMDWALVTTESWPKSLEDHMRELSKDLHLSKIKPGAKVKATGRTSGLRFGQISKAMSIMSYGSRFTKEWSVIKTPEYSWKEWIDGGIGVDGDSGSWIIDRDNGAVYGMSWGRDRFNTKPICIFSPMEDIVADIKERTRARNVCLPGEEEPTANLETCEGMDIDVEQTSPITRHRLSGDSCPVIRMDELRDIVRSGDSC